MPGGAKEWISGSIYESNCKVSKFFRKIIIFIEKSLTFGSLVAFRGVIEANWPNRANRSNWAN